MSDETVPGGISDETVPGGISDETVPGGISDETVPEWISEVDELVDRLRLDLGFLPYDPTPRALYRPDDLYRGVEAGFSETVDQEIYRRAQIAGGPSIPRSRRWHSGSTIMASPLPSTASVLVDPWSGSWGAMPWAGVRIPIGWWSSSGELWRGLGIA